MEAFAYRTVSGNSDGNSMTIVPERLDYISNDFYFTKHMPGETYSLFSAVVAPRRSH
jgi:hypothetical protein